MKITLNRIKPISIYEIEELEQNMGMKFPNLLRNFFLDCNGGVPEKNIFMIKNVNNASINEFIAIDQIAKIKNTLVDISPYALPLAIVSGGNYIYFNTKDEAIYFWDHEGLTNDIKLSNNLSDFLNLVEPFDINQVELQPGQVESMWVDPNFKPEF